MRTPLFHVDAFATRRFEGNPAAVMPMDRFPADAVLQDIAAENNLSETAFLVRQGNDYHLRWFTPAVEVPLCGHATLASAAVVMERLEPQRRVVTFNTASGPLKVRRTDAGYVMDLPAQQCLPCPTPKGLAEALGAQPIAVLANAAKYMVILDSAATVRTLRPELAAIAKLERHGLIVTAPGDLHFDFVSRFFAPAEGIPEDPVTGSAHCALVPYWAERLGKMQFRAFQASKRGGEVCCRLVGDRVELEGTVIFYMQGEVEL